MGKKIGLDNIYGNQGTCDSAGYSFVPDRIWQKHMSSIRGYGQCNRVRLTNTELTAAQTFNLPATFGATTFNDDVGKVEVYHR